MGRLGRITLEDIVNGLLRYVPAFMTAAAIVAVVTLLPGKPDKTDMAPQALSGRVPLERGSPETRQSDDQAAPRAPNTVSPAAPASPAPAPVFGGAAGGDDAGSGGGTFAPPPSFTPSGGGASRADEGEQEPLQIVEAAWASRTAGTPLASEGVPEGSLPVGTRVGQDDKRSFVRLEGGDTQLVLTENPEGTREARSGDPAVRACQVVDGDWEASEEPMSFDDAPEFDEETCVDGQRDDDGTWSFDLLLLDDPTGDAGVALVPGEEAPFDFQAAFEPEAAAS